MKMRVADFIANFLEEHHVEAAFLLSGGGMMHLIDAIGRSKKIKYICNHHEHACALGAEGYSRKSGRLGVCFATSGPGATNTVTGVVECWQDSVPVMFISGQSKLSQTIRGTGSSGLRQFGTFEVDIIPIVQSVTKYAAFLDDPKKIRYHLEKAAYFAMEGRPGPVFIDIPVDLQGAMVDSAELVGFDPKLESIQSTSTKVKDTDLEVVIDKLRSAQRPLVLAGHGVRTGRAIDLFLDFVRTWNIPVVTTPFAADLMTYSDPLYVGHPGMKGDRAGNFAVQSADLILTLGSSLHVTTTGYELDKFAPEAFKIQIDLDQAILKRQLVGVNLQINSPIHTFLEGLKSFALTKSGQNMKPLSIEPWLKRCMLWKSELAVRNEPHKRQGNQINFYDLNEVLSDHCHDDATIVADAGSAFYIVGQAFRTKKNQRILISGALGAMGHAVPVAVGASIADPNHQVVVVIGDGSFQTNIQELATVAYNKCDIKIFVVSNEGYVSIRNTQNNFFSGFLVGTSHESGVLMPSLEKIAASYDIPFIKVAAVEDLKDQVIKALNVKGPVICEILTPNTQEIIPTVSSYKREDGSMVSKPLHDMYPFMDEATFAKYMAPIE
jgi:acetolactate synthase-1/2/3 large subunit